MKTLVATACAAVLGLGYLAHDPTPVANYIRVASEGAFTIEPEEWLEEATSGVKAGNPFWMSTYGVLLLNGSQGVEPLENLVEADPGRGAILIEQAVDKGLTNGLFLSWLFTGQSDETLLTRAVQLGDPNATSVWLERALLGAECSTEGRAVLDRPLPSREELLANQERTAVLFEEYGVGWYSRESVEEQYEQAYAEALSKLERLEEGIECDPEAT
ncbi:MAG: hypothetical protein JJ896_00260 [Rhodothermales bacterium]|nr:hypothetical protein [Rhodothermales bacterium]MBO6778058.1 hypothetical protein [Rhodothermales bacterium]